MAKSNRRIDQELFDRLRSSGLRKSVARQLASAGSAANKRAPDRLRRTVGDLTDVLNDLEGRVTGKGTKRQQAAKKGAATRKRASTRRSAAAKKGAATRARSSSSRSSSSRSTGARKTASRSTGARKTASRSTGGRKTGTRSSSSRSTGTRRRTTSRSRSK
jgi:hypothetical protein